MICDTILDAVGNTPLIRLHRMVKPGFAEVLVKFEGLEVGGSIKTRTALRMIEQAEKDGLINKELQTSGYTVQLNVKFRKAVSTTEPELTIRAKVTKHVRNLAYINAEIINSKGELCNEGEAIYFLMNAEKAKDMGFLYCKVEDETTDEL